MADQPMQSVTEFTLSGIAVASGENEGKWASPHDLPVIDLGNGWVTSGDFINPPSKDLDGVTIVDGCVLVLARRDYPAVVKGFTVRVYTGATRNTGTPKIVLAAWAKARTVFSKAVAQACISDTLTIADFSVENPPLYEPDEAASAEPADPLAHVTLSLVNTRLRAVAPGELIMLGIQYYGALDDGNGGDATTFPALQVTNFQIERFRDSHTFSDYAENIRNL
jgi:hypothetical protein